MNTDKLYYGAAYYAEYLPVDRIEEDMQLMRAAGMNVIRIAESTWSTWEPREGEFDFTILHRVLQAAGQNGISVIVGTPTYAIPPWMAAKYPDILAETHTGPGRYGPRQIMDLTSPDYLRHCEIIIRKLMEQVQPYQNVIGFQLDNETKPYDTCGPRAQARFRAWLQERFGTVEAMNRAFGLAYWSNSLGSWDDLPDVRGTINGSYAAAFEAFQRQLVTEFLRWQKDIVSEYLRPGQFITHNFDFDWRGYGYGLQPDADQFEAAKLMTVAGSDIYHPGGCQLTGAETSLLASIARGLKQGQNFLVLETQAQGPMHRLPYPGQLRLQAFALLAEGANLVEYWHWHSIHNGIECYWKGVLSHDLLPGAAYRECAMIGADLARVGGKLKNLRIRHQVAVMVSNRSLTGIKHSATLTGPSYNDMLRRLCDVLYAMNVTFDVVDDTCRDLSGYTLLAAPCLYCAEDSLIECLKAYVAEGGCLLAGPRSFFADQHLAIRHAPQPFGLTEVFGMTYDQFTPTNDEVPGVDGWMELLRPVDAQPLLHYRHPAYRRYAAATLHDYGKGRAAYLGAMLAPELLEALLTDLLPQLGVEPPALHWPLIAREGVNDEGHTICYLLNYSDTGRTLPVDAPCVELLTGDEYAAGDELPIAAWGVAVLEPAAGV